MKTIFVPVLKTKRVSEKNALKHLIPSFDARNDIIPYLEIIKKFKEPDVKTYKDYLGNRQYFAETLNEKETDELFSIPSAIPVLNTKKISLSELTNYVGKAHDSQRAIAIRMIDGDVKSWQAANTLLKAGDFLFIDIDTSKLDSSFFLKMVGNRERVFRIVILSNERSVSLAGRNLIKFDLNDLSNSSVNVSVIEAIKNGTFQFDGFASYCAAKNDLTEEIKKMGAVNVNGYMLIYSYDNNAFGAIVSDVKDHISVSYRELLPKIKKNMTNFIDPRFAKTPISKRLIDEAVIEGKLSCQKTITIMIVHYIEEIMNNLNIG